MSSGDFCLQPACFSHESNSSFLHNELQADPNAHSKLTLLVLYMGLSVSPGSSCPKRAVAEPSLERPGCDEGQLSLERFLHHSKGSSGETSLLENARDKDFSHCFHFRCFLYKFSWNIPAVRSHVLRAFLLHELPWNSIFILVFI